MVTCADSQIRILHGVNVVGRYRGLYCSWNLFEALFFAFIFRRIVVIRERNVKLPLKKIYLIVKYFLPSILCVLGRKKWKTVTLLLILRKLICF